MATMVLQIGLLFIGMTLTSSDGDQVVPNKQATPGRGDEKWAIQVARSEDGQQFESTGEVFARAASRPSMVRLPAGDLLAIFECPQPTDQNLGDKTQPVLFASRSKDDGKTWLAARPVNLRGLGKDERVASADLLVMPSGLVRMYFSVEQERDRAAARTSTFIGSAVTRDGVEFVADRQVRIACPEMRSARVCSYAAEKQIVLLVTEDRDGPENKTRSGDRIQQFVSRDGRAFLKPDQARLAGKIGHVLQVDAHHWRMYLAGDGLIRSRMSNDGTRWRDESGICLRTGFDPAVAVTSDKRFVMLFCSPMSADLAKAPQLAEVVNSGQLSEASAATSNGSGLPAATSEQASQGTAAPPQGSQAPPSNNPSQGITSNDRDAGWDAFAPAGYESELGSDWSDSGARLTDSSTSPGSDLAPLPDFTQKFDYVDWYARNCIVPDDENAYYSYEPFLDDVKTRADQFKNMFNGEQSFWPPVPWNPTDHPEWENSYQTTQDLMQQYLSAGQDTRSFSSPLQFGGNSDPNNRLLIEYLLPSLASMRSSCKQTLGAGWRATDGQIPPEQMRGALEAVMGNVGHLQQGPTLIENLVGVAERTLAEDNARWALYRGVFNSPDELQATLQMLQEKDVADPDPGNWVRGEHAMAMDTIQYIFEASAPGEDAATRSERMSHLLELFAGPNPNQEQEQLAGIAQMSADEAQAAAQEMTGYYQQVRDFYQQEFPYASAGRFHSVAVDLANRNKIAGLMLPSLTRAGALARRSEASRRATQLTYSVELFKTQNGRYPASLDELPSDQVQQVRTDPYSGQDFVYRLTESGPTIYSLSENGRDDGGVHSRRWGDEKQEQESDDYVFWPPQE